MEIQEALEVVRKLADGLHPESGEPDYALAFTTTSLSAQVNTNVVFNGTITAVNGYNSAVALSCGAGAPATCTISPANLVPGSSGVPFTVTVSSGLAQAYVFSMDSVGTDSAAITHSVPLIFTALPNQTFDFTMSATPSKVAVPRGNIALFSLAVNPTTRTFPANVTPSCSGLPALTTCNFNPVQVGTGNGSSVVTISVTTTAPLPATSTLLLAFPAAGILLIPVTFSHRRRLWRLLLIACLGLTSLSCGGGLQGNGGGGGGSGSPGTKVGDYTITITATCGTVTHSTAVTLSVTP